MINEYFFADKACLFTALVKECHQVLSTAIEQRQAATLLVSGGSTPQPLYRQLSLEALDWEKVSVALVDERWVGTDEAGSNETFIRENLLLKNAGLAHFTGMKTHDETALQGQPLCEQHYQALPVPFDLTILGMGPDGHTASLFPQAHGLEQALDINSQYLCAAINAHKSAVTGELTERMSLSLYGLLQSRTLYLLITGEEKLSVYKQALTSSDPLLTPISSVLQQTKVPVDVYWAP